MKTIELFDHIKLCKVNGAASIGQINKYIGVTGIPSYISGSVSMTSMDNLRETLMVSGDDQQQFRLVLRQYLRSCPK